MSITSSGRSRFPIAFMINAWLEAGVLGTVDVIYSRGAVVSMWVSSTGE